MKRVPVIIRTFSCNFLILSLSRRIT